MIPETHPIPLFESDEEGKLKRLRGEDLPSGLLYMFSMESLSDWAPAKDTLWVIRGAYRFARRVQGKPEVSG